MRDYDPERDDWTHTVQSRHNQRGRDVCVNGRDHEYASGECIHCEAPDPYTDDPRIIHAYDTRDTHLCFDGCRHARTPEGRYVRPLPDLDRGDE